MAFRIARNDITKMKTQAVVNTANSAVAVGPGCDSAIYKAAGYEKLLEYRRVNVGKVSEGEAFVTPGFDLEAEYIIHVVSPVYTDGEHGEEDRLRSCYRNALGLALEYGIRSVSFPLISTGSFGYPKEEGMRIAVNEINAFLLEHDMFIYLVVFGENATRLGERLQPGLEEYIDRHYVENKKAEEYGSLLSGVTRPSPLPRPYEDRELSSGRLESESCVSSPKPWKKTEDSYKGKKSVLSDGVVRPSSYDGEKEGAEKDLKTDDKRKGSFLGSLFKKRGKKKEQDFAGDSYLSPTPVRPDDTFTDSDKESLKPPPSAGSSQEKESFSYYDEELDIDFEGAHGNKLQERMQHISDTFSEYLLYLIREKNMTNSEVYKRAILDKKVFSKIKNNPDYHPGKMTVLCLCVGARLSLDESRDLLARAGYALSPCDKTDIIFAYFIENGIYDMLELDIQLEAHGLPCIIT